jgi:hypothetical protein
MRGRMLLRLIAIGFVAGGLLTTHTASLAQSGAGWTTFTDQRGTQVQYPADVFAVTSGTPRGRRFVTQDGRSTLHVYTGPNERGESPAQLLRRTFPQQRSRLTYDHVARNFFAMSARHNNQILYRRCNFQDRTIHCIDLTYPLLEKRAWDDTVTRISRSLRPL